MAAYAAEAVIRCFVPRHTRGLAVGALLLGQIRFAPGHSKLT